MKKTCIVQSTLMLAFLFSFTHGCDSAFDGNTPDLPVGRDETYIEATEDDIYPTDSQEIILGEKLPIPYSIAIMRGVFQSEVSIIEPSLTQRTLQASHLYLRVRHNEFAKMDELFDQHPATFFPFPLDYEILNEGDYYRDRSLPSQEPQWFYSVVSLEDSEQIPPYFTVHVLDSLYFPEEDVTKKLSKKLPASQSEDAGFEFIEDRAFEASGLGAFLAKTEDNGETEMLHRWRPKGSIFLHDKEQNIDIPIVGAPVVISSFCRIVTTRTDENGNFVFNGPRFRYKVRYRVKWEGNDFDIRNGMFFQAKTSSYKIKMEWHPVFDSSRERLFAATYVGAYYYYHQQTDLRTPPKNKWYRRKVKIRAFNRAPLPFMRDRNIISQRGCQAVLGMYFTGADIKVYRVWNEGTIKPTFEIIGTSIHELAHASHWALSRVQYNKAVANYYKQGKFFIESWANGVEWYLNRKFYSQFVNNNRNPVINEYYVRSCHDPYFKKGYTGFVVDLMDGGLYNQNGTDQFAHDTITIENVREIEDALENASSLSDIKSNLSKKRQDLHTSLNNLHSFYENAIQN